MRVVPVIAFAVACGLLSRSPASGQISESTSFQGVQGVLLDPESGQPVRAGEVTLRDASRSVVASAVTDGRGSFRLLAPRAGLYRLAARALGYADLDQPMLLLPGRLTVLEVRMVPAALEIEPVVVTVAARSFRLDVEGFYERRGEGVGIHVTPELLEARRPNKPSDLFFGMPGVRVAEPVGGVGGRAIHFRGALRTGGVCWPMLYVDRQLVSEGGYGSPPTILDDAVSATDIEALEIYRSGSEVPAQFSGANSACGAVVVWTYRGG